MDCMGRIFLNTYISMAWSLGSTVFVTSIKVLLFFLPKYVIKNVPMLRKIDEDFKAAAAKDKKREVEGVVSTGSSSESVEPILDALADLFSDEMLLYYMPFFVYIFIQFRTQCGVPANYAIRQSDMKIYMYFQVVLLPFQTICDVLNIMAMEVFHGWKIYEYLVYSRYRFIQRETRWKGMEDSLDECIDEGLRQVDQMCFSSQFYMMNCMSFNGMVMIIFAITTWLQWGYNVFADPGVWPLTAFIGGFYIILEFVLQQAAIFFELWKVKHENTNWHLLRKEEEDIDIPGWEDIKGASHEAYLMNQRITSETFRYKFLNYNRCVWIWGWSSARHCFLTCPPSFPSPPLYYLSLTQNVAHQPTTPTFNTPNTAPLPTLSHFAVCPHHQCAARRYFRRLRQGRPRIWARCSVCTVPLDNSLVARQGQEETSAQDGHRAFGSTRTRHRVRAVPQSEAASD